VTMYSFDFCAAARFDMPIGVDHDLAIFSDLITAFDSHPDQLDRQTTFTDIATDAQKVRKRTIDSMHLGTDDAIDDSHGIDYPLVARLHALLGSV
jgi:hypothetical protein